ncbi:hypothetical protein QAD02_019451 [Eretmocerus hayati]|uniref:Uncharacterized protein n=1 Tax=Eretmocerus hayati TaxID=131215 RepID=A0ACC2PM45_9HYME|nr:hypothetical protein QAD02_019451 [Eretmocerus hayati]
MCLYKLIAHGKIPIDHICLLRKKVLHRVLPNNHIVRSVNTLSDFDKLQNSNFLHGTEHLYGNITDDFKAEHESEAAQDDNDVCQDNANSSIHEDPARLNEINLQMLPGKLHDQIFKNKGCDVSAKECDVSSIKEEFDRFGITPKCDTEIPSVNIAIPGLRGQNIEEHFLNIANEQAQPYINVVQKLMCDLPPIPNDFVFQEGWTKYGANGPEAVEHPEEDALVFDVEVCMKNGPLPTLATAASPTAWYSWVSKQLIEDSANEVIHKHLTPDVLIPLESTKVEKGFSLSKFQQKPKIIVGHNISYDRVRVKEQYWLNTSATKFLDTMSLHIAISGTNSYQRAMLRSNNSDTEIDHLNSISSLNNLVDVYKLYCKKELDKTQKDIFVDGDLQEIKKMFNESMMYCASDVAATHEILRKIFPMFEERFPHPATFAGMLELSSTYLPVNHNWKRFIEEADTTYDDLNLESKICLSKKADLVCRLMKEEKYKLDPWMWNEDWSTRNISLKKGYEKLYKERKEQKDLDEEQELKVKFQYLIETRNFLPKKMPHMPGYPNWYRKLCYKQSDAPISYPKTQKISNSMLITPKLLNLTWNNHPLHHIRKHGWGFLVPYKREDVSTNIPLQQIANLSNMKSRLQTSLASGTHTSIPLDLDNDFGDPFSHQILLSNDIQKDCKKNNQPHDDIDECCHFFKLPHKNGVLFNVGNPLSKDFLSKFSENVLAGADASAARILEISKLCSYWKNNRDRILSQLVIWLDSKDSNTDEKKARNPTNFGVILPQVVVSGTVTRRAVEPTWMTASNAHSERIGSELRSMIAAPTGYSIVGADVDSQELWIASVIGDAFTDGKKIQGGTPFSWMTLIGSKSQGTDMHSVTAKVVGISRDQAKIINYARIYGAGQKFAERLLKQFNPTMSDTEAAAKSKKMFAMTKGKKSYRMKKKYLSDDFVDKPYSAYEALKISKLLRKSVNTIFGKSSWIGGTESAMFNSLEAIAHQPKPSTPFLNSRLSRALESGADEKHLPTKINWVVQSSAVDFLHLILVCMRWLMKDKAKLCLTFHDEVRYLVPSKQKYNAALAMHVTNLLVRSFFVSRLKMNDLPMSVAFFTAVEVDSILRKEATQDCKTPSNPQGLQEGYGISHGESLSVWDAVDKSKGCVGVLTTTSKKTN